MRMENPKESGLRPGLRGELSARVTEGNTAESLDSGALPVLATPYMIALMEGAAWHSVQPYLEEGCGTVGTALDVRHLAPTPVGRTVRCESLLTGVEGRKLTFSVQVYDGAKLIGEGSHERFIIRVDSFLKKAYGG